MSSKNYEGSAEDLNLNLLTILNHVFHILREESEEVLNFEWSAWRFDSHCEFFSLLDGNKLAS